jgi:hypothetical protein
MPLYVIERRYAEEIYASVEDVTAMEAVNADENISWIFSFLTVDRRRTYCLYEAPSPDAILAAARRLNIPADAIVEVSQVSADSIRAQAALA